MKTEHAPDVQELAGRVIKLGEFGHVDLRRVVCMRSFGSKGRSIARIWPMPKIWKKALGVEAHYVLEVISERFDKQSEEEKIKTVIHELLHIPKSFSGALVSHRAKHFDGKGGHVTRRIDRRSVERIFRLIK